MLQARGSQTQSGFRDILRQLREAAQRANSSNSGDAQPAVAPDVGTEHGAAAVMKQQCTAEELDKRLGPAPVGTMEEALADRARANKRIRELRKESKSNPVCAGSIVAQQLPDTAARQGPHTRKMPNESRAMSSTSPAAKKARVTTAVAGSGEPHSAAPSNTVDEVESSSSGVAQSAAVETISLG